jgi:penicillin-binding protein 2
MSRFGSDESQNFEMRLSAIQVVALIIFAALGFRFWGLQVVKHKEYDQQAKANQFRKVPIPAPRGNILDRNGNVLVDSRPSFAVVVSREDLTKERVPELLAAAQEFLGVDAEWARAQIYDNPKDRAKPVTLKTNLTEADRAWIETHEYEFPEFQVELQPQRIYPHGEKLAHVLGYVGEISRPQLEATPRAPEYEDVKSGDIVGQAGIERSQNRLLTGRDGYRLIVVDSRGRFVDEIERVEPVPGQDLYTTIDLDLQNVAEAQLAATKYNGAVVFLDPRNGEVLAMVSLPSYNPELFAGGITPQNYALLRDNPDKPLRNRPIQDIYPPGSTWKGIMAMAALSEHAVKPEEPIACGGGIQVGNRFTACHGSHGAPDVERALAVSCNGYFYRVGLKLGVDKISKWARTMGFDKKTGIDLPNEQPGYVPSRDIKLRFKPKNKPDTDPQYQWKDIDTVHASIGQGYDRPTPLQMVHAFAGIAMNGRFTTPHLLLRAASVGKEGTDTFRPEVTYRDDHIVEVPLDPVAYHHVVAGMREVVTAGTARRAEVAGFDVCGKTGTAQVASIRMGATGKLREHAWFVGFAPMAAPEIAWAIVAEHGGHGGVTCAPVAQAIIAEYVRKTRGYDPMATTPAAPPAAGAEGGSGVEPDAPGLDPTDEIEESGDLTSNDAVVGDAPAPTIVPQASEPAAGQPAEPPPPAEPQIDPLQGIMRDGGAPPAGAEERPKPPPREKPPAPRRAAARRR